MSLGRVEMKRMRMVCYDCGQEWTRERLDGVAPRCRDWAERNALRLFHAVCGRLGRPDLVWLPGVAEVRGRARLGPPWFRPSAVLATVCSTVCGSLWDGAQLPSEDALLRMALMGSVLDQLEKATHGDEAPGRLTWFQIREQFGLSVDDVYRLAPTPDAVFAIVQARRSAGEPPFDVALDPWDNRAIDRILALAEELWMAALHAAKRRE